MEELLRATIQDERVISHAGAKPLFSSYFFMQKFTNTAFR